MRSFTELNAAEGSVSGLLMPGAVGMPARLKRWMLGALGMVMVCLMSATAAEPPEKPAPKKTPVSDDVFVKPTSRDLNKEDTPLGRYYRQVTQAVEKRWHANLRVRRDAVSPGRVEVVFRVNTEGKLDELRVLDDRQSHLPLTEVTLQSVMEAKIPPMPAEVIPSLPMNDPKHLKVQYTALIYTAPESSKGGMKDEKTARGRYYRQVLAQVQKKWDAYHQQRMKDVSAGSLKAEFYVNKKGRVEGLRVIDDKKSNKVLTEFTLRAIKDAEIPPMPADVIPLLPKNEPERLKIEYDALID